MIRRTSANPRSPGLLRPPRTLLALLGILAATLPAAAQPFLDGDFSDPGGGAWSFVSASSDDSVSYASGAAVVTGADDGTSGAYSYIEQAFNTIPLSTEEVTFTWSYSCSDSPSYDGIFWDLVDTETGLSVVGGPVVIADAAPDSGVLTATFTGSGYYSIHLGTWSSDGIFGAGVSTFDDVSITGTGITGDLFVRGDANGDGAVNVSDAVRALFALFVPGAPPVDCADAADIDDDGELLLDDAVQLLSALFVVGSTPPAAPFPTCGIDDTDDSLDCALFDPCP